MQILVVRQADQFAGMFGAGTQRLVAHHVQAALQGQLGVLVMQGVRRGDDNAVEAGMLDQLPGALGGEGEAEAFLDPAQLGGAQPADRG